MVISLQKKILSKKELNSIDSEIFEKIFLEEKKRNSKLYSKIEEKNFNEKSKEFKEFVKIVRKRLREIYGVFFRRALSKDKLNELVEKRDYKKILSSHLSTYERKNHFENVYGRIFNIAGKPKKILDLGCGFNPFSYKQLGAKTEYVASDISSENLELIQKFAKNENLPITTIGADLTNPENLNKISEISKTCDVTFCFKLLDSLEAQKRGTSKTVLEAINSPFIIVSFPTGSISGKNKIRSERKWFRDISEGKIIQNFEVGGEEYFVLNSRI